MKFIKYGHGIWKPCLYLPATEAYSRAYKTWEHYMYGVFKNKFGQYVKNPYEENK